MEQRTLAGWMEPQAIGFDVLHQRYSALLGLVKTLLGVVPNCDRYMEIWPVSFRSYNLMVPNFINLPQMLLGLGAPKDLVGLALYASSRASECPYCTAHCCSFAQRRGAAPEAMTGGASPEQAAVLAAAEALGAMPHRMTEAHIAQLRAHLKPENVEWIGMGIAMMGFLNKFMDAMGVPLETASVADSHAILAQSGMGPGQHYDAPLPDTVRPPKDNWRLYLSTARLVPGALRFDAKWLRSVPKGRAQARGYLQAKTGLDVALLERMSLTRPRRALAAMLRENLDPLQSTLGLRLKGLSALLFAEMAGNAERRSDALQLLQVHQMGAGPAGEAALKSLAERAVPDTQAALMAARGMLEAAGLSRDEAEVLCVARALCPSPAALSPAGFDLAVATLAPEQMVELVTWLSLQQLMHRLDVFLGSAGALIATSD